MKVCQGIIVAVLGITIFACQGCQQKADPIDAVDARSLKQVEFIKQKSCEVVRVSDGDTIAVRCEGEELKIRFCGIDAPEQSQPLGKESKAKLRALMMTDGGKVLVTEIERDRYGRTVAEVEVAKGNKRLFVNAEMVRVGMAYHYAQYSKNCPHRDAIASAEEEARSKKIGVWNGDYEKPWDYRKAQRSRAL